MKTHDKIATLAVWTTKELQDLAREARQVAAEEANAIVEDLLRVVMGHVTESLHRALTEGCEQLRAYLHDRMGGN